MNNDFFREFLAIRDETLKNVQLDNNSWNKFITYWSKILDKYSVDNVLNLYNYNSTGRTFMTFDEWNSEEIGRRIKPKSKGIPIIINNWKGYVFDIRQTYGKDYRVWNYNHFVDKSVLEYYQDKVGITNDEHKSLYENFYDTFYELSIKQIMNDYTTMTADEVEFVAKTMTSLFLAKANFNIYNLPSSYELLDEIVDTDDILKCMQIANKETAILYNDFIEKATSLENIQNYIQTNVLFQFKDDKILNKEEKQNFLSVLKLIHHLIIKH